MKTAKFVKDLSGFVGDAKLYKVSPWIKYGDRRETNYVVVSRVDAFYSGLETYIFPSDEKGKVLDWGELDGSQRGNVSHEDVLKSAGFIVK